MKIKNNLGDGWKERKWKSSEKKNIYNTVFVYPPHWLAIILLCYIAQVYSIKKSLTSHIYWCTAFTSNLLPSFDNSLYKHWCFSNIIFFHRFFSRVFIIFSELFTLLFVVQTSAMRRNLWLTLVAFRFLHRCRSHQLHQKNIPFVFYFFLAKNDKD